MLASAGLFIIHSCLAHASADNAFAEDMLYNSNICKLTLID